MFIDFHIFENSIAKSEENFDRDSNIAENFCWESYPTLMQRAELLIAFRQSKKNR